MQCQFRISQRIHQFIELKTELSICSKQESRWNIWRTAFVARHGEIVRLSRTMIACSAFDSVTRSVIPSLLASLKPFLIAAGSLQRLPFTALKLSPAKIQNPESVLDEKPNHPPLIVQRRIHPQSVWSNHAQIFPSHHNRWSGIHSPLWLG